MSRTEEKPPREADMDAWGGIDAEWADEMVEKAVQTALSNQGGREIRIKLPDFAKLAKSVSSMWGLSELARILLAVAIPLTAISLVVKGDVIPLASIIGLTILGITALYVVLSVEKGRPRDGPDCNDGDGWTDASPYATPEEDRIPAQLEEEDSTGS